MASASRLLVELGRDALARSALGSAESTLERAAALSTNAPHVHAIALELLSDALSRSGKNGRCLEVSEQLMPALACIDADASRLHAGWLRLARAAIAQLPTHLTDRTSADEASIQSAGDALRRTALAARAPPPGALT